MTKDFQTIHEAPFTAISKQDPRTAPPFWMESGQTDRINVVQDDVYKGDITTQDYDDKGWYHF